MLLFCHTGLSLEAGADEAGRGCLSGPVTGAAVLLPEGFESKMMNDSKQLTEKQRLLLRDLIQEKALSFSVCHIDHEKIDAVNILNASIMAMQECARKLSPRPAHLVVDGNRFKEMHEFPHTCIIGGDAKYLNIAAASILAKTHRDDLMRDMHREFPMYNWHRNKGYPTLEHRDAIRKFGASRYHRMSFRLLPEQFQLDLKVV